ncbi:MAG TPA: SMI1/KNR4 family protein [Rhizomicrobium sp.]|nr:SMI1/KNR4 family protein [Rhizomicrobium sp.]
MTDANIRSSAGRFVANPPAGREETEKVQSELKFALPKSYVDFLLTANGGEGFTSDSYVVLWRVEDLVSRNAAYNVAGFAPGLFLFGSNGGGEAFGFDTGSETCSIVSIPFVTMDKMDARLVATNFERFISTLSAS